MHGPVTNRSYQTTVRARAFFGRLATLVHCFHPSGLLMATMRLECLGRHWFLDLDDAREKVEEWPTEYNEVRPDSAIGDRMPWSLIRRFCESHWAVIVPALASNPRLSSPVQSAG
jgi:transposase InsO family protein